MTHFKWKKHFFIFYFHKRLILTPIAGNVSLLLKGKILPVAMHSLLYIHYAQMAHQPQQIEINIKTTKLE